ncbi:MAG: endonuclease/exonuclease/phosphatase family protein [Ancrocorticia sp.]|uniref:endonuclease/exonuclease/phosphatase family protein n=1 Tax=Ancrocorticia sp. TaxID=2593684 RepID=UPI003F8E9D06
MATFNCQSGKPNGLLASTQDMGVVEQSAAMLAALAPDIVCLQEVRGTLNTPFSEKAGATWSDVALARRRYNPRKPHADQGYGIAMYSRLPVLRMWVWWLPSWRSPVRRTSIGTRFRLEEQRRAIVVLVDSGTRPTLVCGTHLAPGIGPKQLAWLESKLDQLAHRIGLGGAPRIIMGDLNIREEALRVQSRYALLASADTYPSDAPRTQIDHIIGQNVKARAGSAHLLPISDHRALIGEVDYG